MSHEGELNLIGTLTGVPGVGKGFYRTQLELRGEIPEGLGITSTGDELFDYFKKKPKQKGRKKVTTRDDLKYLSQEGMDEAFVGIVPRIIARAPVLLDSHVVTHRNGTELSVQKDFHLAIGGERFWHVVADPKIVAEQRANDPSRQRVKETADQIDRHQTMSLEATRKIADELGAKMVVIENTHSREQDEINIKVLREELRQLMRRSD